MQNIISLIFNLYKVINWYIFYTLLSVNLDLNLDAKFPMVNMQHIPTKIIKLCVTENYFILLPFLNLKLH